MDKVIELKPCPFCGGEAKFKQVLSPLWMAVCTNERCQGGCGMSELSKEATAKHWNARAPGTVGSRETFEAWYAERFDIPLSEVANCRLPHTYDCVDGSDMLARVWEGYQKAHVEQQAVIDRLKAAATKLLRIYNKAPENAQDFITAVENGFLDFERALPEDKE